MNNDKRKENNTTCYMTWQSWRATRSFNAVIAFILMWYIDWLSSSCRWTRLRLFMCPFVAIVLEPLGEGLILGWYTSWSVYHLLGINPVIWFLGQWFIRFLLDWLLLSGVQVRMRVQGATTAVLLDKWDFVAFLIRSWKQPSSHFHFVV